MFAENVALLEVEGGELTFQRIMALLTRRQQKRMAPLVHHDMQRMLQRLDQR